MSSYHSEIEMMIEQKVEGKPGVGKGTIAQAMAGERMWIWIGSLSIGTEMMIEHEKLVGDVDTKNQWGRVSQQQEETEQVDVVGERK